MRVDALWVRRRNMRKRKERRRENARAGIYTGVLGEAVSVVEYQRTRENGDGAVFVVTEIKR